jgi:hypothetical protein
MSVGDGLYVEARVELAAGGSELGETVSRRAGSSARRLMVMVE